MPPNRAPGKGDQTAVVNRARREERLAMQEQRMSQLMEPVPISTLDPKVSLLFYGPPGSQKTTTACRVGMEQGRVLLYEIGGGEHKSLDIFPDVFNNTDRIKQKQLNMLKVFARMARKGHWSDHSTLVIDSLDSWCDLFLSELSKKTSYGENSRHIIEARSGVEGASDFINDFGLTAIERSDYNVLLITLGPIIEDLVSSDYNVIFVCHSRLANKTEEAGERARPDMPEKTYNKVVESLDAMAFFEKQPALSGRPQIVKVRFASSTTKDTKSRIGVLRNKDFSSTDVFINAINSHLAEKNEESE